MNYFSPNSFAGSDTTATSIRAILLHVISNPLIYARLRQEVDTGIANGSISDPAKEEEIRKLPYLQACIREGLRIFPPITYLRERVTPPQGDTLSGFFVPGGVNIGFNLPGLLLDPVFDPDARTFRPERWINTEPGKLSQMERVMDLVFGWGSTRCLGIRMANANQSKFFVEVLRRWDIVITRPIKPWSSRCHGIFYQKDFFVCITPRECK
jgi:cytochrome P450